MEFTPDGRTSVKTRGGLGTLVNRLLGRRSEPTAQTPPTIDNPTSPEFSVAWGILRQLDITQEGIKKRFPRSTEDTISSPPDWRTYFSQPGTPADTHFHKAVASVELNCVYEPSARRINGPLSIVRSWEKPLAHTAERSSAPPSKSAAAEIIYLDPGSNELGIRLTLTDGDFSRLGLFISANGATLQFVLTGNEVMFNKGKANWNSPTKDLGDIKNGKDVLRRDWGIDLDALNGGVDIVATARKIIETPASTAPFSQDMIQMKPTSTSRTDGGLNTP